jgi:hypothetical protein
MVTAAEEAGLSLSTIKRYLANPTFAEVYRAQRSLVLQETVSNLLAAGSEAVNVLCNSMNVDAGDPNLNLRAARAILDFLFKGVEIERKIREQDELEARLEAIEDNIQYELEGRRRHAY